MKTEGYVVTSFGNAISRTQTETVIYDYSGGKEPEKISSLATTLNAKIVKDEYSRELSTLGEKPDILVILGTPPQNSLN